MEFLKFSLFLISCSLALSLVQAICRNEPEGAFIPDPAARNRFFFCSGGQALSGICPAGQEFDPFDRFCDTVSSTNPSNPCQGVRDGTFLPDRSNRARFFYCIGGQALSGQCDPGEEFNPVESFCDRVGTTTARPQPTPPNNRNPCLNQPDGMFVPDPSSRRNYFWCNNGQGILGSCPAGEIFNVEERFCDVEVTATTRTTPRPPVTTTRPVPTRSMPAVTTRQVPVATTRATVPTRPGSAVPTRTPGPTRATTRNPGPTRATTTTRGGLPPPTRKPQF